MTNFNPFHIVILKELLKYDQLKLAIKNNEAFENFKEGEIKFPPTFKFVVGTNTYKWEYRKPAWTGRVLYRTKDNRINVQVLDYKSYPSTFSSDHKLVSALLRIKF